MDYSNDERHIVDQLLNDIAAAKYPLQDVTLLAGQWIVVYIQPSPITGVGIDRRIPFIPDNIPFNNNYQIFSINERNNQRTITNIGQLLGLLLSVQVDGTWKQLLSEETNNSSSKRSNESIAKETTITNALSINNRFQAAITGGKICSSVSRTTTNDPINNQFCWITNLPISGIGIFESIYLGKRLRIGQNINGGGARIIQLRIS